MTDERRAFAGVTAASYATFRRDVPDALIESIADAIELTDRDLVLDLGCGTGQVALPLARRARLILAVDPEPDMLEALHARLGAMDVANVIPVLGADRDLVRIARTWGGSLAAVTIANALHWMDAEHVVTRARELLRPGGALIVISQGPPMWLAPSAWSRALRHFLEGWTGGSVNATCGTDRATLEQRAELMRAHGYQRVKVFEHAYENAIDLPYIAGRLRTAISEATLPPAHWSEFETALEDALSDHLQDGPLIERIRATALIGIARPGLMSHHVA